MFLFLSSRRRWSGSVLRERGMSFLWGELYTWAGWLKKCWILVEMAETGLIIVIICFCFFLLVGGGAGLYYGNVACPSFGASCSPAPSPGTPSGSPGPSSSSPGTPSGSSISWQSTTTSDESDQTKLLSSPSTTKSAEECKTLCANTPNCTHVVRLGSGVCKMYSGAETVPISWGRDGSGNLVPMGSSVSYCKSQCQAPAQPPVAPGPAPGSSGVIPSPSGPTTCPPGKQMSGAYLTTQNGWNYSSATCTDCPVGYYGHGGDQLSGCIPCSVGTYSTTTGQSSCTSCPSGQTTLGSGSTSSSACYTPLDCPTGFTYSSSDQQCHNATTGESGNPLDHIYCGDYDIYPYQQGCTNGKTCVYMNCQDPNFNPNG